MQSSPSARLARSVGAGALASAAVAWVSAQQPGPHPPPSDRSGSTCSDATADRDRLHAPLDRRRSRRGPRDRGVARCAGRGCHALRHGQRLLPRRHGNRPQRTAHCPRAGCVARGPFRRPHRDQGRPDPARGAMGSRRPRPRVDRGVRIEPDRPGRRKNRPLSVARAGSARAARDERARAARAAAPRADRRRWFVQRHRRPDRRGAAHHRRRRGAGRAEPVARPQRAERRRRVLHGQWHSSARYRPLGRSRASASNRQA